MRLNKLEVVFVSNYHIRLSKRIYHLGGYLLLFARADTEHYNLGSIHLLICYSKSKDSNKYSKTGLLYSNF